VDNYRQILEIDENFENIHTFSQNGPNNIAKISKISA
jgi:hypothetical protein